MALQHLRIGEDYDGQAHYSNYHPLQLGIIMERSTGMSVSEYLQEKIWAKVGAENNAPWSLDSESPNLRRWKANSTAMDGSVPRRP